MSSSAQPPAEYAFWQTPDQAITVVYSLNLFHEIDFVANEGYRRIPHGGMELAGLLFGRKDTSRIRIEAFRSIESEHAFGPSFNLSDRDLEKLQTQLSTFASDPELSGLEPVGWFVAHSRSALKMSEREVIWFDRFFKFPRSVAVLVKPERFKPTRFAFVPRVDDGQLLHSAAEQPIILPLAGRARGAQMEAGEEQLIPSLPAPTSSSPTAVVPPSAAVDLARPVSVETPVPVPAPPQPPPAEEPTQEIPVVAAAEIREVSRTPQPVPETAVPTNVPLPPPDLEKAAPVAPETPAPVLAPPQPAPAEEPTQEIPVIAAVKLPETPRVIEPGPEPVLPPPVKSPEPPVVPPQVPMPFAEPVPAAASFREAIRAEQHAADAPTRVVSPAGIETRPLASSPLVEQLKPPPEHPVRPPAPPVLHTETVRTPERPASAPLQQPPEKTAPEISAAGQPRPATHADEIWRQRVEALPLKPAPPVVPEPKPAQIVPALPAARPRAATTQLRNRPRFAFVVLIAALLGCYVGYFAYLQIPSAVIPLTVKQQSTGLVVLWPAAQTQHATEATIQVGQSQPVSLSAEERAAGQVAVPADGNDIRIELVARHWPRDSRGIVRFVRSAH